MGGCQDQYTILSGCAVLACQSVTVGDSPSYSPKISLSQGGRSDFTAQVLWPREGMSVNMCVFRQILGAVCVL